MQIEAMRRQEVSRKGDKGETRREGKDKGESEAEGKREHVR